MLVTWFRGSVEEQEQPLGFVALVLCSSTVSRLLMSQTASLNSTAQNMLCVHTTVAKTTSEVWPQYPIYLIL